MSAKAAFAKLRDERRKRKGQKVVNGRVPLKQIGKTTIEYERDARQPFLENLWLGGEVTAHEDVKLLLSGATMQERCLPKYAATGTVEIRKCSPSEAPREFKGVALARRVWFVTSGDVHHEARRGSHPDERNDMENLVLLNRAYHRREIHE